ncbi:SDR family oxidoreductase [Bacteriovoracales bacterium]|nr:SDR family oxidoreductase [Bacteriovoracales bacterium]
MTGGNRGIGKAISETFAQNKANLIITGRNEEQLSKQAASLEKNFGINVLPIAFDLRDYDQIKEGFKKIYKHTKNLDIMVNNAGILDDALIGMISKANVHDVMSVNLNSAIFTMQYCAKLMKKRNCGTIINISSIIGRFGNEGQVVYSGSKAGLIGASKSAAKELGQFGIRVNVIAPGFIDTEMTRSLGKSFYEERLSSIKMKRVGTPQDVANTALFLSSDLSSYVTGQVIGVDGGMVI